MGRKKIYGIVILCIVLFFGFSIHPIYATEMPTWDELKQQADGFISSGKSEDKINDSQLQGVVIPIAQMLVGVANVVLLVVTTIIGIQYMTGGPEKRAASKQKLIGLVVATVVIFAAQFIWKFVYNFMSKMTVASTTSIERYIEEFDIEKA